MRLGARHRSVVVLAALALSACGNNEAAVADTTWQITDVYTESGTPSAIDDSVAGAVELGFGGTSVTGFTGCAPLAGIASFTNDSGALAAPEDATRVSFSQMQFRPIDEDQCTARVRFIHDALVDLLADGSFIIRHDSSGEMIFQEDSGSIDPRAIRLAAVG